MTSLNRILTAFVGAAAMLASTNAGASTIDLTGGYNICSPTDGATVCSAQGAGSDSTGSGTFPSFVGTNGGLDATFLMYNTTNVTADGNSVGTGVPKNRDATLGDFAVVNRDGVDVFTFVLDINQFSPNPLLSVDHVSIFMGDGSLTGYNAAADTLGGVAATWAMPAADSVTLNYLLAGGSGHGDMFLYIPTSFFSAFGTTSHLQLYSTFGAGSPNNDGFEEWAYLSCSQNEGAVCYTPPQTQTPVPEPGTFALLGLGLAGLARRRRAAARS